MGMMSEDGLNSGARNVGRFFLMAIPYVLGLGAMMWLGVYVGVHDFHRQLTQEERAAVYTGAQERPKAKMVVEIVAHDCSHITRADIDGGDLVLYSRNDCHQDLDYLVWYWQEVSPNGTILNQGYNNLCPEPRRNGDVAECRFDGYGSLPIDDRTDKIKVWTQIH
jgi:hypothetical protein